MVYRKFGFFFSQYFLSMFNEFLTNYNIEILLLYIYTYFEIWKIIAFNLTFLGVYISNCINFKDRLCSLQNSDLKLVQI